MCTTINESWGNISHNIRYRLDFFLLVEIYLYLIKDVANDS